MNTAIVKQRLPCLFLFIGESGIFCFLDYVEELYQFYLKSSKEDLASAVEELKKMTPQPMVSMFDKQPKEAAVQKRSERKRMVAKEVPPTVESK